MLDAISEQIAQRTAQIVLAHLAPALKPVPVEEGQIVGVSALARYLECDRGRSSARGPLCKLSEAGDATGHQQPLLTQP